MPDQIACNIPIHHFRERFEEHEWASTPLGERSSWPAHLKVVLELTLEAKQPMFLAWGSKQTFLFNEAFAGILGRNWPDALGASLPKLWAGAWGHMGHFFADAMAGKGALMEDHLLPTWASSYQEYRYFSFAYSPVRHEGAVVAVLCICSDTTQQVKARELVQMERDSLSRAFEDAPGFIALTEGADHRFTFTNAAYRRLIGGRHVVGSTVAEALPEVVEQGLVQLLDEVFQSKEPFTAQAMPVRLQRNVDSFDTRFMDFVYAARVGPKGEVVGLFCEGQDVTDRVLAANRITSLQSQLIHASRGSAMNIMASTLAHELNQPLAAINGYASAATNFLADGDVEQVTPCLSGIQDNALRAGKIIRSARRLVEQRTSSIEPVSIKPLVDEVLQLISSDGDVVSINMERDLVVLADRLQLQQVLLNLLRNAIEAADADSPLVELRATAHDDTVRVTVIDNGSGIQTTPIEAIFEMFSSSKADGLGLGLAISRTIIEAHGGRMWAENRFRGGAAVSCELPRYPA